MSSRLLLSIVSMSIALLLPSGPVNADGAVIVFQVRTDAVPEREFDELRVDLWRAFDRAPVGSVTHIADARHDYETGVRVAEIELTAGFDDGEYRATVGMYLGGGLVFERPIRLESCCHSHGTFGHRPPVRVITVLMSSEIDLVGVVEKEVDPLVDPSGLPGDTVRYRVEMATPHPLARTSVFRDSLDPDLRLLAGSVRTSSGVVFKGNLPSDSTVEVRLGSVPAGRTITIEYDAVVTPVIENQGDLRLGVAGTRITYPRITDDPTTITTDDPTRLVLSCKPQDEQPVPPAEGPNVFPETVPQFAAADVRISGKGFGTQIEPPVLIVGGVTLPTAVLPFSPEFETVEATVPAVVTAEAGVVPFSLVPADPQLPPVKGIIQVQAAAASGVEVVEGVREVVSSQVNDFVGEGLAAFQAARDLAAVSRSRCKEFRRVTKFDLERILSAGSAALRVTEAVAVEQALAVNANSVELDDIKKAVEAGDGLLHSLLGQLSQEALRGNGLLCLEKDKPGKQ